MKNKLIIIGIILIIISISLSIYNNLVEYNAGKISNQTLNYLNNIDNLSYNNDTINIDGYDYIGTIIIPTLNLELPIMDKYDYTRLKLAPCLYYGSIYTNDLIICAHSYKTHFGNISNLKQKDNIIIKDIKGNIHLYEVLEIEVLKSTDITKMIDNDFDLTLYTCTSDSKNRVTVRCNKIAKI